MSFNYNDQFKFSFQAGTSHEQSKISEANRLNQQQKQHSSYQRLKQEAESKVAQPQNPELHSEKFKKMSKKMLRKLGKAAAFATVITGTGMGVALSVGDIDFSKDPSLNFDINPETGEEYKSIYQLPPIDSGIEATIYNIRREIEDPQIIEQNLQETLQQTSYHLQLQKEAEELQIIKQRLEEADDIELDESSIPPWEDYMSDAPLLTYPYDNPEDKANDHHVSHSNH